ncbi:MAG: hypothetical protein UU93_C0002G0041 [Candidatus Amesbacteria bacterium GW2011_GWA2_42_12]|uniref:Uncharacterized protein n=1 Tax=Candidatus Amesbacteria bacterium GW2011_GWA2_42_12 TaxID=1618356 RepID=A0A0G1B6I8_9BACT|nr:MAG: hypothetical protein UU93_C0002G0041 [Candidatus Amesbacteria bacterium GW2011_GWA2_42_12]
MAELGGIDLLEPIDPAEWAATPTKPTTPQLEPDPITEADLKAEPVDNSLNINPTVEQPSFPPTPTPTPPSEAPIETPVRIRG